MLKAMRIKSQECHFECENFQDIRDPETGEKILRCKNGWGRIFNLCQTELTRQMMPGFFCPLHRDSVFLQYDTEGEE